MQPHKKSSSTTSLNKTKLTVRGLHGEGDGVRQNITCRKSATPGKRPMKIEKAKIDKQHHSATPSLAFQSASIAEITPTKTPIKRISSISTDTCDFYATPRPFDETPKRQLCNRDFNACKISRLFLRGAWMRSRADIKSKQELIEKLKNQITQMEMEKQVLSELRTSESQKREEQQKEYRRLKKNVDLLELENCQLSEESESLQNTLEMYGNNLKVAQAENNFLSEQSLKMQEALAKNKSEKMALDEKMALREEEIETLKSVVFNLKATVEETVRNLYQARTNYGIREKKYIHLKCQFKTQLEVNNSMSRQLMALQQENQNVSLKAEDLEMQLNDYIESCATLKEAQETLDREVMDISARLRDERKRQWFELAKRFALLSWRAVERIAHFAVPAYMNY